jgi:hypothetical protein
MPTTDALLSHDTILRQYWEDHPIISSKNSV